MYFDYAATTPIDPDVLRAMEPYFGELFGNPSSAHSYGQVARKAIEEARKGIALILGCPKEEIFFTSGASESDNLAVRGLIEAAGQQVFEAKPHVITTAFEHKAVLDTVQYLEEQGTIEATFLRPDAEGLVSAEDVKSALRENTVLVSIVYVNNEVGTIQPIRRIGEILREENEKRELTAPEQDGHTAGATGHPRVYFHTDAVQAVECCNLLVNDLRVDLLSLSGHKIYGPKGIGVLYVRKGTPLASQIHGGTQERGVRAGTENVPGIVGFAVALQKTRSQEAAIEQMRDLKGILIKSVLSNIPNSYVNGSDENSSSHIVNFSFDGCASEDIFYGLDARGIAASMGSACLSQGTEPSYALVAMGLSDERAAGGIRFSLGLQTTREEVEAAAKALKETVAKIRERKE